MNSPAASPDRGSTLVLIDDGAPMASTNMTTAQTSANSSIRTGIAATHPPDPLLYGLQTMEWRPWLRPAPGSSSSVDEYMKTNDDFPNYRTKTLNDHQTTQDNNCILDLHGVRACTKSQRWWAKSFWTLLLLAATAGLAYELYRTVEQFWWHRSISGSYVIKDVPFGESVSFPDIYVCPTNPINDTYRRRRRTDLKWFQILSAIQQKSNPDGILGKLLVNWDYFSQPVASQPSANISNSPWVPPSNDQQQFNTGQLSDDLPNDPTPSPLNIDSMRDYFMRNGYETDAFLVECAFRSKSFKCSEMAQPVLDRKHGKCFLFPFSSGTSAWPHTLNTLFNMGNSNASWRVSNGVHSFSLAMNIHTELYPKENGSLYDGVYMYVDWRNDPGVSAFKKPILLPPGAYSSINLESREIRVHESVGNCVNDESDDRSYKHQWTVLNSPRYYKEDLCKFDCLLRTIMDSCRCLLLIDGRYVNRSALIVEQKVRNDSIGEQTTSNAWMPIGYCTMEQLNECAYDILQQYDSEHANNDGQNSMRNCTRSCRPACGRREYALVSNSLLKLPAESYLGSGPNYPYPWNELKNNYVLVDVVLENGARTTVVDHAPSLNLELFLGMVGGQMSIFLGCSILTFVQIVVLFLTCCKTQCQRVYTGKCLTLRKTLRKMRHSSLLK